MTRNTYSIIYAAVITVLGTALGAVERLAGQRLRRRLTLSHDDEPFLERWGLCHDRLGGFYVHKIAGPDPGMDLHDHPWAFVSIVLRGGYFEHVAQTAEATEYADNPWPTGRYWGWRQIVDVTKPNGIRRRKLPALHRMPLDVAHRIVAVDRNTWTLVLRGPTRRVWGFYPPTGRVDWREYDYETRRPSREVKP